ncbi:MAG TPA: glycosyltransferase family 39 protein [Opitutaceae bacterium]|nr:glycosyltransferase family 39 protein [Opitutaceae bacterium]
MEPDPAVSARSHGRVWTWAAIVLAALHFAWLYMHWAPAIMSPDANGYVAQARLIAEQGRTSFTPSSTVQYIGMHWLETPGGIFHSRYPAGLPLAMALAWKVGGLDAALLINPLLGSATVLLVFFLARRVTPGWAALVATAVVAVIPVANQHALDADAHVAATFCLVAGILALLHFGETLRPRVGFVAGLLLGLVPTIRYPEAIVGLTVAAWLLYFVRPRTRFWPAIVGAALPIALLCAHNAVAYGAFWRTGYALTNEQTGFGVGYFFSHVLPYLQNLSGPGLALFFGFGVAGIAALAVEPATRRTGVLFAGIVVPLVMLYMAYYWGAGGGAGAGMGNLRFLLPTLPFLAVGGAWVLAALVERLGAGGRAAAAVVVALQLLLGGGASQQMLAQTRNSIGAAARVRALAEKQIPPGSVLIVDRTLGESLDAVGQWKLIEENFLSFGGGGPRGFGGPGGPGAMGGPGPMGGPPGELGLGGDTPNPQQVGKNRAQQERYAGLRGEERRARIWADVQAWAAGRPVFWFTRSLDVVDNQLPAGADYESLAEVDAPSMFGPGGGGGPPMGGAMPAGPGGRGAPGGFVGGRGMGPGRGGPGQFPTLAGPGGGGPGGRRGGAIAAPNNAKLRLVRVTFGKP